MSYLYFHKQTWRVRRITVCPGSHEWIGERKLKCLFPYSRPMRNWGYLVWRSENEVLGQGGVELEEKQISLAGFIYPLFVQHG